MEYVIKEIMCVEIKRDSVTVGTVRNMHNLLSYGVVGKSVCRMWKAAITGIRCTCSAAATVPASGWTSVQSRPSPSGRPQRQSFMRLCGIRCKDYTCISDVLPEDAFFTNVLPLLQVMPERQEYTLPHISVAMIQNESTNLSIITPPP